MNSLRKAFLALSLLAAVPATVEAKFGWETIKGKVSQCFFSALNFAQEKANDAIDYAKENPRKATAIGLGTVAVAGGAGYLAKKYQVGSKIAHAAGTPKRLTQAGIDKFNNLSRTKKAGVVVGGAVVAGLGCYLGYRLYKHYRANGSREI